MAFVLINLNHCFMPYTLHSVDEFVDHLPEIPQKYCLLNKCYLMQIGCFKNTRTPRGYRSVRTFVVVFYF